VTILVHVERSGVIGNAAPANSMIAVIQWVSSEGVIDRRRDGIIKEWESRRVGHVVERDSSRKKLGNIMEEVDGTQSGGSGQ
jgi:hypothetical protein